MKIKETMRLNQETEFEEFYKKSFASIPSLKKFAASKLKLAENEGLIDKGFYDPNEILDEVFLEVFKIYSHDIDEKHLRQTLFLRTIQKINHKIEKENQFAEDLNIDTILKDELNLLKENYSVEADGDYIFDEDLDDISYKQNSFNPAQFILDQPMELEITGKLDLNDTALFSDQTRALFGATFYTLPPISKNIIELYVFGNQDILEISETLKVSEDTVRKVIDRVKERLEKL
jgi:DNA-directed RNA polymerase specialized sigma24 family protein